MQSLRLPAGFLSRPNLAFQVRRFSPTAKDIHALRACIMPFGHAMAHSGETGLLDGKIRAADGGDVAECVATFDFQAVRASLELING